MTQTDKDAPEQAGKEPDGKKGAKKAGRKKGAKKTGKKKTARAKSAAKPRGKKLVIVESPAKARTIGRYLGSDYGVQASMGHVRDLPKKEFGVDVDHDFEPKYVTLRGKNITALRRAARSAPAVYLAPDPDREGEAIAWHLMQVLDIPEERAFRVSFNEITEKAIRGAFDSPGKIDTCRVDAQQARRILDRIVGYRLSPVLWKKIAKGLSAGRVQSVALRLCAEREKEIRAFKVEEYWKIAAKLLAPPASGADAAAAAAAAEQHFEAELREIGGEAPKIPNEEEAKRLVADMEACSWRVEAVNRKKVRSNAPPPFTTSLMQQAASVQLGFTARKTMTIAQQLYEGVELGESGAVGLITYMRTDSFRVADDALAQARGIIGDRFGGDYLPEKPNTFRSRKGAQEAHEAIRPTYPEHHPEAIERYLSSDQAKLYRLIWNRFIASQMSPARYDVCLVDVAAAREGEDRYLFRAKGRHVAFDGHTVLSHAAAGEGRDKRELPIPELSEGQEIKAEEVLPSQHFTQPPPRYTEASLIKTLEKEGIGRPSTYATIISTIQDRGYVRRERRQLIPTELGIIVSDALSKHFPTIMDVGFTRDMEEKLDSIEGGKERWTDVLRGFYGPFTEELSEAEEKMEKFKGAEPDEPVACEKCGKPMVIRVGKTGRFLGCSGFPECRNAKPLDGEARPEPVKTEFECPRCGKHLLIRVGRRGKFFACSGYPDCRYTANFGADGKPVILPETDETCPKCGTRLVARTGRRGPFLACPKYPKCRYAKSLGGPAAGLPEIDEKCDKCGRPMIAKWGRRGPFIACTGYPDCKNAKPFPQKDEEGEGTEGGGEPEVSDIKKRGRKVDPDAPPGA
ncbi:MAG: type I DNA topoisomerase [Planctomycetota bacterium]